LLQKNATRRAEKKEASRFSVNDYYNPEGQHRHYERNLKSIPKQDNVDSSTETFNPMMDAADPQKEREGARRMANELYRRIEKQKNKRDRLEFEETDVGYINKRNKRYNQKISRNYDKSTAEIKQNLERGTAL
jgi:pre-mRNA-splicing factor SYF2